MAVDPLIPGVTDTRENLEEVMAAIARVGGPAEATLDLPGFGHSPMPAEQISISGYARLLLDGCRLDFLFDLLFIFLGFL